MAVGAPLLTYVAPYQTVCNQTVYFLTGLGGHMSEDVKGGTIERVLVRSDNPDQQPGKLGSSDNYRPADLPSNVNPKTTKLASGDYAEVQHGQPYAPAIDAAGNADCQTGQNGYPSGPLPATGTPEAGTLPAGQRARRASTPTTRTTPSTPSTPAAATTWWRRTRPASPAPRSRACRT